jgi:serine protease AprX
MADKQNPKADFPQEEQDDLLLRVLGPKEAAKRKQLIVLDESNIVLPLSKTQLHLFKLLDPVSGEELRLAASKSGKRANYDKALAREQKLHFEKFGVAQAELYRLAELGEQSELPVLIKYVIEEEFIDKSALEIDPDDDTKARAAQAVALKAQERVEQETAELHQKTMARFNLRVADEVRPSGPFVSAVLPAGAIRELARDPRVAFIGMDQEKEVPDYPTIAQSLPTTGTQTVHSSGSKGAGVKIAVLEGGTLTISQSCFNIGAIQSSSPAASSHMTKSVGIIGNRYSSSGACSGSWQGYAPDAKVYLANVSDYKDRYDWAKSKGVNVVTMSWHFGSEETNGGLHSRDVYFDYWVTRYPYPTIFTSAGNQAGSNAYASGKGYNFFGVGNVLNDGDGNRCNDVISSDSSWKNPTSPHSDREIPEIAAPGSRHDLLGSNFGGTSCATPVAASIAALLMSKNSSLKIWPEAVRAIMLATANYQKADGSDWSKFSDGKDGVGMLNTWYGSLTAGRRETGTTAQFRAHDYGSMRASDFSGGYFNKTWKARTNTTNARIRVAVTWNSKVTTSSSVLDADLDLHVFDPDGHLVAWSSTWDSNYEFVEFKPTKTGNYTIKIRGFSVPSSFVSYYGVAWTTHYDLCS